jgi:hypothetical protein
MGMQGVDDSDFVVSHFGLEQRPTYEHVDFSFA